MAAGIEYEKAQNAFDEQALITQQYQEQADAAQAESDASRKTANQLLAELGKTGGGDLTANLLGDSDSADSLLYRLGAMTKATERLEAIYAEALRQQKTAQALTEQAEPSSRQSSRSTGSPRRPRSRSRRPRPRRRPPSSPSSRRTRPSSRRSSRCWSRIAQATEADYLGRRPREVGRERRR